MTGKAAFYILYPFCNQPSGGGRRSSFYNVAMYMLHFVRDLHVFDIALHAEAKLIAVESIFVSVLGRHVTGSTCFVVANAVMFFMEKQKKLSNENEMLFEAIGKYEPITQCCPIFIQI